MLYSTYPDYETLKVQFDKTPDYMFPSMNPYAAILEGYLTDEQCNSIINFHNDVEPYSFRGCGATTRETPEGPHDALSEIRLAAEYINHVNWRYELRGQPRAWMQSYEECQDYQMHMDGNIGQTRKLTAVALLSPANSYWGGDLELHVAPNTFVVPRTRGTIVVFPPWLLHKVRHVSLGFRQTINMGFWGPPFK